MPLCVRDLVVGYGKKLVVREAALDVGAREVVALIGHNGAGKSTLLNGIFGVLRPEKGSVVWNDRDITADSPAAHVRRGICYGLQGAQIYRTLSIAENLRLGAFVITDSHAARRNIDLVYQLFPILQERRNSSAGTLSGGERQMLALGSILAAGPELLLLDEPSGGLAPMIVEKVFDTIREIVDTIGLSVILVEQNLREAFRVADRAYVMTQGRIVAHGKPSELEESSELLKDYFGEGAAR
ncbi:MAG TPA: ABC transporter ATP-binding protein [Stellaceae bacterium]|nr:ABC transporter ATP-binding protein [Stellaceae bacterium]